MGLGRAISEAHALPFFKVFWVEGLRVEGIGFEGLGFGVDDCQASPWCLCVLGDICFNASREHSKLNTH